MTHQYIMEKSLPWGNSNCKASEVGANLICPNLKSQETMTSLLELARQESSRKWGQRDTGVHIQSLVHYTYFNFYSKWGCKPLEGTGQWRGMIWFLFLNGHSGCFVKNRLQKAKVKMGGWLKATVIIQPIHYEQNSSEDGKKSLEIGRFNRIYSKSESEVWEREFKDDSKVFGLSAEKMFPLARLGWPHSSFEREDHEFTFR